LLSGAVILVTAGAMTAGGLIVFLTYLSRFFKPVQDLAKMTNSIAQTSVATERIRAILETDEIIRERPDIVFDHVAFRYDADAPVLRDVSFRIEPGQFVGIVGPTGSGKSTVVSLIPRFYDPTAGRVLIDGVDVRDYQLQHRRYSRKPSHEIAPCPAGRMRISGGARLAQCHRR
jgi:subfamily B ATP-binding cassette protein MsbA